MKKVIVQFSFPGVTSKQFDQAWDELRKTGVEHPEGLVHHVAGQNGNNWIVVDIWESEEAFMEFGKTLMPILTKVGIPPVAPMITPVYFELAGEVHA